MTVDKIQKDPMGSTKTYSRYMCAVINVTNKLHRSDMRDWENLLNHRQSVLESSSFRGNTVENVDSKLQAIEFSGFSI